MTTKSAVFVIPGDVVVPQSAPASSKQRIVCGRGIAVRKADDSLKATVAGYVHENGSKVWVNSFYRRYFAQSGDRVIGVVTHKFGDCWRVDIGGIEKAEIEFTSFENATKRNRPDVRIGDLLYGTVNVINKHLEPVLTCVDAAGKSRGMGILPRTGTVFTVACSHARRLLTDGCPLIGLLGKSFKFEITIGVNGRIWLSGALDDIRFIQHVIEEAEKVADDGLEEMFTSLISIANGEVPPALQTGLSHVAVKSEPIDADVDVHSGSEEGSAQEMEEG